MSAMRNISRGLAPILSAITALASCAQGPLGKNYIRVNTAAFDDSTVTIAGLDAGPGVRDESLEIAFGSSKWRSSGGKEVAYEMLLESYGESSFTDVSGGARKYFGQGNLLRPYGSIYGVVTDIEGFSTPQLGLRFGGGAEYAVGENFFLDFSLSYLLPLSPALDDFSLYEVEVGGWTLRAGVGWDF